jgi:hypothetical protein
VVGDRDDGEDYVGFLEIFDVHQPANPDLLGQVELATQGYGVALANHYAYVVGQETAMTVVDVSDPLNPVPTGAYRSAGWAQAVQVAGDQLFIAGESIGCAAIDARDPARPVLVGSYPLGTGEDDGWDLQVVGNHAYLARGFSGLLVFEITEVPFFQSVSRAGDKLVLSWKGTSGTKVQRTTSLTNPNWNDVQGSAGQSVLEVPLSNGSEFFRLLKE